MVSLADGQGVVLVGLVQVLRRHEFVPWHLLHHPQHVGVRNVPRLDLRLHHAVTLLGEGRLRGAQGSLRRARSRWSRRRRRPTTGEHQDNDQGKSAQADQSQ